MGIWIWPLMIEVVCYLCSLWHLLAITDLLRTPKSDLWKTEGFEERNTVELRKG